MRGGMGVADRTGDGRLGRGQVAHPRAAASRAWGHREPAITASRRCLLTSAHLVACRSLCSAVRPSVPHARTQHTHSVLRTPCRVRGHLRSCCQRHQGHPRAGVAQPVPPPLPPLAGAGHLDPHLPTVDGHERGGWGRRSRGLNGNAAWPTAQLGLHLASGQRGAGAGALSEGRSCPLAHAAHALFVCFLPSLPPSLLDHVLRAHPLLLPGHRPKGEPARVQHQMKLGGTARCPGSPPHTTT